MLKKITRLSIILLVILSTNFTAKSAHQPDSSPKYLIVMIADGQGKNHQLAANLYTNTIPDYQNWSDQTWASTYPSNGSYDPSLAWTNFAYLKNSPTDSAAAATAILTGEKTVNGRISVSADGSLRLTSLGDLARTQNLGLGAVSSSYITDATPAAITSHNSSRVNYFSVADEALWGDPETTGLKSEAAHAGGYGITNPPVDVWLGAGKPTATNASHVSMAIRDKLATESGQSNAFTYIERISGQKDAGLRLIQASESITVTRLAGLFGDANNLGYRLAAGSAVNLENPTLAEMTQAALNVLGRNPKGFVLLIEGGAIDHAAHANLMDAMVGEMIAFNQAVETVTNWVNDPQNGSTWENTLVVITADHETGYLTGSPGVIPNPQNPIGPINQTTLAKEKLVSGTSFRASWDDVNSNNQIDPSEQVYWAWNSAGHTNSLVPVYAKGVGAAMIKCLATMTDPVRGLYLDNTQIFSITSAFLTNTTGCTYHEQSSDFVNKIDGNKYFYSNRGNGLTPWLGDNVTISFSTTYTDTDQARIYYTRDESTPSGSKGIASGSTQSLICLKQGTFGTPTETIFTCQSIPSLIIGESIHYKMETWNANSGFNQFASSTNCSNSICATDFQYHVIGLHPLFFSIMAASSGLAP